MLVGALAGASETESSYYIDNAQSVTLDSYTTSNPYTCPHDGISRGRSITVKIRNSGGSEQDFSLVAGLSEGQLVTVFVKKGTKIFGTGTYKPYIREQ